MSSVIDEMRQGLLTGIALGLLITFVVGAVGMVLMHYCIVPAPVWCSWQ